MLHTGQLKLFYTRLTGNTSYTKGPAEASEPSKMWGHEEPPRLTFHPENVGLQWVAITVTHIKINYSLITLNYINFNLLYKALRLYNRINRLRGGLIAMLHNDKKHNLQ